MNKESGERLLIETHINLPHVACGWSKAIIVLLLLFPCTTFSQHSKLTLSLSEYENKVQAVWAAQMIGALMGFPFEHKVSSVQTIDQFTLKTGYIPVDDDWYYEMVAVRAFEKYGFDMSLEDLGKQWVENSAGTWGSSEQTLSLLKKGISAELCGHPQYNKLWFSIGPQFSADVYGALAPGMPNVAAALAGKYGRINGYAEGLDGAVFIAGMISLGFKENNTPDIVRKAASLIDPRSPYRQCLDLVIEQASRGKTFREVVNAVEDRWHIEYPATNNAVANGGIVAACVWFGKGDFLTTINLAFQAADFTDADCNAANAGAVVAAMKGLEGIPQHLLQTLGDTIAGEKMGNLTLTPAVHESLKELSRRTAVIGKKILIKNGARISNQQLVIPWEPLQTRPSALFTLADLTRYWNPDWKMERAGFGGAGGGMGGIRGMTYLNGNMLATYPRDEVRGLVLTRSVTLAGEKRLVLEVGADSARCWELNIFVNNNRLIRKVIEGNGPGQTWYPVEADLSPYQNQAVTIRLYQRVLLKGKEAGNAYWKSITLR
ncbi:MAG TPA: ADP-ribosylglycohydrolase family protein [Niabella sp.]|nr:ADP-ribosylglycohydrolase family protein [Niabella sp.]